MLLPLFLIFWPVIDTFFSTSSGLIPVPLHFRPTLSHEGDPLLCGRELRQLPNSQIRETSQEGLGAHLTFQGCQSGLEMLLNEGRKEATGPHSFSELAVSNLGLLDISRADRISSTSHKTIIFSKEMTSSFNLLLNSTLFGRNCRLRCLWSVFGIFPKVKHPPPHPTPHNPCGCFILIKEVLFGWGRICALMPPLLWN